MSCGFDVSKDPQADLDYRIAWGSWLAEGDSLASSSWAVQSGSGLVAHDASIDGSDAIVWLSGGVVSDVRWSVTNTITTAEGRTDERSLMIKVEER